MTQSKLEYGSIPTSAPLEQPDLALQKADGRDTSTSFEFLDPPPASPLRETNTATAVLNLCSTIVGGGVLSLPFSLRRCGLAPGLLVMALSALASEQVTREAVP